MQAIDRAREPVAASRWEMAQALLCILWIFGWVGLAVYAVVIWIPGLAFGAMFAALALPLVLPVMHE